MNQQDQPDFLDEAGRELWTLARAIIECKSGDTSPELQLMALSISQQLRLELRIKELERQLARVLVLGGEKPDWRVGLACKPKYPGDERYHDGMGIIRAVEPSGTGGMWDRNGVLRIEQNGKTFLARADDWVTA